MTKQQIAANRLDGVNSFLSFNTSTFIWGQFFTKFPNRSVNKKTTRQRRGILDKVQCEGGLTKNLTFHRFYLWDVQSPLASLCVCLPQDVNIATTKGRGYIFGKLHRGDCLGNTLFRVFFCGHWYCSR